MARAKASINLLPREDFERTILGRIMKWALTSFRFIVIAVEFVVIAGFMLRFWLDVQISDLDDEINQKAALVSSRSSFEQEFRSTQDKLAVHKQLTDKANQPSVYFEEVSRNLPSDTQLISFAKSADSLEIIGATLNEASITGFVKNLETNPRFTSVNLSSISTRDDSPLVEFVLKISTINTI